MGMAQADVYAVERNNDGKGWQDAGFRWQADRREAQALARDARRMFSRSITWRVATYTVCAAYRVK